MNIIEISAAGSCAPTLAIGKRGENLATQVRFDFSSWAEEFGEGRVELYARRCGDENAYPVTVTVDGTTAVWTLTATDTHVVGYGTAEFVWIADETVVKSVVFGTIVEPDIGAPTDTPPEPYESWLDTLTELAADTQEYAERAETAQGKAEDAQAGAEAAQAATEEALAPFKSFTAGNFLGATGVTVGKFEKGLIATPAVGSTTSLTRVTSTTGKYSAYLPVTEGQRCYIAGSASTTSYRTWAFLDADLAVLERQVTTGSNPVQTIKIAPENAAWIVANTFPEDHFYLAVDNGTGKDRVSDVAAQINDRIGTISNLINIIMRPTVLEYEAGIIRTPAVGQQGTLTRETSTQGRYSAYHTVEAGQKVIVSASRGTATVRPWAFLDEDLIVLSVGAATDTDAEITAPSGSAYVVSNSLPRASPYAIIIEGSGETAAPSINVGMFNRIGLCGYSWDSGYAYPDEHRGPKTVRSRSWGAVLANMYGIDYSCYGVPSGTTCAPDSPWIGTSGAVCWQTAEYGLPKLLAEDPCDLYWCHMYGNDWKKLGLDYLGTIADITDTPESNPDTFYGNYGRIMAQITAHAPNALFVFSYRQKGTPGATQQAYTEALLAIAQHYGVPVINWNDDPWFNEWMNAHLIQSHPTFPDYAGMAKAADRLFAKCAAANWNYFRTFTPAADPTE